MKSKDIFSLVIIACIAAVFSMFISGKIFGGSKHDLTAAQVQPIESSFPDIKNDASYKSVFNNNALNPTQLIQIGNDQNQQTFSANP